MLKINELARLYLGIQGENGVRSITVDVSAWINLYPNGSVTVWHKRCGDSTPSPTGAVYDSEEQTVTWDITSVDTFVAGIGEAEFRLIENEVIKKTAKVMTGVSPAVTLAGTELGSDWASYINAVDSLRAGAVVAQEAAEDAQEAAEDAKEAAEDAQEAAEDAQTAAETAQGKAEDAQTAAEAAAARAEHASKVMVPEGGTEGQRLAKKSGTDFDMEWKTDPYYTKPAGGIPASDMAEGAIPDPTSIIDDTAGDGDTNKVWSADKSTELMSAIQQVTPEQFGAKGDGTTDDSQAVQDAVDAGYAVRFGDNKTYYIPTAINIDHDCRLFGGENTVIKTATVNGSLNNVFVANGTLKKTTTLTTDYDSDGSTANSGNQFTLTDMTGIAIDDIMVIMATDQYYNYSRQYYYLGGTLLIGDIYNGHLYATTNLPFDIENTENVSVKIYSAPQIIIEKLNFVADMESGGNYKYFVLLNQCRNSIIRNCRMTEMDSGIRIDNCFNTLIESVEMSKSKELNSRQSDGYGVAIYSCTNTVVERVNAICSQSCVCLSGDTTVINTFVKHCSLCSECRPNAVGSHENSYNTVIEDCTLTGVNILGTGLVNRCRFIKNNRINSGSAITFCGSHNPKFAVLKVSNCVFEGECTIYLYSSSPQNPIQAFDNIFGLVEITDCDGGFLTFEGTTSQYILSNVIKELRISRWSNCKEVYLPNATDIIEKMVVTDCSFTDPLWINDHNNHIATGNIYDLEYRSSIPMMHKITVNKDVLCERYTLPENVSISLSSNSQTAKYVVCGNNLAPHNADDIYVGSVSGSDGGTLVRSHATGDTAPTISINGDGDVVFTQKNNTSGFDMFPVGLFYAHETGTVKMSAKIKSASAVKFRPYMAIVNCKTGKLISRYMGTAVEATSSGATISYEHSVGADCAVLCYFYCSSAVANAVTTFVDYVVYIADAFAPSTAESIQPYEARRRTGDGTVLSLPGVNNIMCSEDTFHVSFGTDFVENPVGLLPNGTGVSF